MELILDVKILIALVDEKVWIKLVLLDDEFKKYAYTIKGAKLFINQFTVKKDNCTYLFDKLHSIDDVPSRIYGDGKYWYYNGKKHRENDLPTVIYDVGTKYWYCKGLRHRENDLPAIICDNGTKYWYYKGEKHRENNLPAIITNNDIKYWYYKGERYLEKYINITKKF